MLPLFLLLIFAKNYLVLKLKSGTREEEDIMLYYYDEDEDADPDSKVSPATKLGPYFFKGLLKPA